MNTPTETPTRRVINIELEITSSMHNYLLCSALEEVLMQSTYNNKENDLAVHCVKVVSTRPCLPLDNS